MKPTPEATYERSRRLANVAMWSVSMQCRRLRSVEVEDETFVLRRWADFEFLIVALTRLRRAVRIAAALPQVSSQMSAAISAFDQAIPGLKQQRDVAEHIDEYAVDSARRHDRSVRRKVLEVGVLDDKSFQWLGHSLSVGQTLSAAEALFSALQGVSSAFAKRAANQDNHASR